MLNAISFYRVSRWLYLHHIPVLPKLITLLIFLIYNSKIPYQAKIGRGQLLDTEVWVLLSILNQL